MPQRREVALEVDPHGEVPLVLGGVGEHAVPDDAGVVHNGVEPAPGVEGRAVPERHPHEDRSRGELAETEGQVLAATPVAAAMAFTK
mgnify:CR=1 FL=1